MKNQTRQAAIICALLFMSSCKKVLDIVKPAEPVAGEYKLYNIRRGQHYSDHSSYTSFETSSLKFIVKFDSSCVYKTILAENQWDVNKLYGFSDNQQQHHEFSARIGWRWSDGALRLFGYTYNNGVMDFEEITSVPIGAEIHCEINVQSSSYQFIVNNKVKTMARTSNGTMAKGYRLYPYFGGDETAPHDIRIWIKEK